MTPTTPRSSSLPTIKRMLPGMDWWAWVMAELHSEVFTAGTVYQTMEAQVCTEGVPMAAILTQKASTR